MDFFGFVNLFLFFSFSLSSSLSSSVRPLLFHVLFFFFRIIILLLFPHRNGNLNFSFEFFGFVIFFLQKINSSFSLFLSFLFPLLFHLPCLVFRLSSFMFSFSFFSSYSSSSVQSPHRNGNNQTSDSTNEERPCTTIH